MPNYTLYYSPGSASLVVHWLLLELNAPHTLKLLNFAAADHKQPAYLAINPAGLAPAMLVDGVPICESAAIMMYLADAHSESRLAPAIGTVTRGHYYQWICLCVNVLMPAFRSWFYPSESNGDEAAVKANAQARIEAFWQRADTHLAANGPFLLGTERTAADFMLTMLMRWSRNMPKTADSWPALGRLAASMKALPSFAELYKREELTEWT